jgi:hypothetical protein
MNRLWLAALPELRAFPSTERDEAMRKARAVSLDVFELLGMAAGLVAVTALTRYALHDTGVETRVAMALLNFAVVLPLLAVVLAPFHMRRLRRGLRAQLAQRSEAPRDMERQP